MAGELLDFGNEVYGLVLNLEQGGRRRSSARRRPFIKEGDTVKRTGRIMQVPVGEAMIGRVVDALGRPIDGKGPIDTKEFRRSSRRHRASRTARAFTSRCRRVSRQSTRSSRSDADSASSSSATAARAEDGNRCRYDSEQKGRTVSAFTSPSVRRHRPSRASSRRSRTVARWSTRSLSRQRLQTAHRCSISLRMRALRWRSTSCTRAVMRSASMTTSPSMRLRTARCRCIAARTREYPGDVFCLPPPQARGEALRTLGAGSIGAADHRDARGRPFGVHPDERHRSANGQIMLDANSFYSGIRPAINASVSRSPRVGGSAQIKAMKQVAGRDASGSGAVPRAGGICPVRLCDLDKATKAQLDRGARMVETLKRAQYSPLSVAEQVLVIFTAVRGHLTDIPVGKVVTFHPGLPQVHAFLASRGHQRSRRSRSSDDALEANITAAVRSSRTPSPAKKEARRRPSCHMAEFGHALAASHLVSSESGFSAGTAVAAVRAVCRRGHAARAFLRQKDLRSFHGHRQRRRHSRITA